MTNYEKIKAMSVEEMVGIMDFIADFCPHLGDECPRVGCTQCYREWLLQEAEE